MLLRHFRPPLAIAMQQRHSLRTAIMSPARPSVKAQSWLLLIAAVGSAAVALAAPTATVVAEKPLLDPLPHSYSPAAVGGMPPADTMWTDALTLGVHGKAWPDAALPSPYTRLPTRAQAVLCNETAPCYPGPDESRCRANLCEVWSLSNTPTGLYVQFSTASPMLYVRFRTRAQNGDWLWAYNGHSGLDLYAQEAGGPWRWATSSGNNPGSAYGSMAADALAQPGASITNYSMVLGPMANGTVPRNFTLYLSARGLLQSVEVGVPRGEAAPVAMAPRTEKPVVLYGTSILHGAAAGRAGMVWSTQLSRVIDQPVINLGFSGHGLMQQQVGALVAEAEASVYVLDCEWNMCQYVSDPTNHSVIENITYHFLKQLRTLRPETPVALIEGHDYTPAWAYVDGTDHQSGTRNGYRAAFARLVTEGDKGIFYLNGSKKLGGLIADDFEAQAGPIAGVHVGDYAFRHFAEYVGEFVQSILNGTAPTTVPEQLPIAGKGRPTAPKATQWVEAMDLAVEGLGWPAEAPTYGRLPARAVPDLVACGAPCKWIYNLSEDSSGVLVRFESNSSRLSIRVQRSLGPGGVMPRQDDIMSWNGRYGVDVYTIDDATGKWRWFATSAAGAEQANETLVLEGIDVPAGGSRKYTVYFPTHTSVTSVAVGHPPGTSLLPYHPHAGQKPVLVWGSSIAQGGVVQNAGMTWPVSMGRILDREVLNFGFSGACQMQPAVAKYLGELKPEVFVVDCLPNMDAASVTELAAPLIKQLRVALGPTVPLVFLEGHTYSNAWILPEVASGQAAKRAAQLRAVQAAQATDKHLHYVSGDGKLASLGETQYDATAGVGVHPTNIAHLRIAQFVSDQLQNILPGRLGVNSK